MQTLNCPDDGGGTLSAIGETPLQFCLAGPEADISAHCDANGNIVASAASCKKICSCIPSGPQTGPLQPSPVVQPPSAGSGGPQPSPIIANNPPPASSSSVNQQNSVQPTCGQFTLAGFGVEGDVPGGLDQTVQAYCTGPTVQGQCSKSNPNAPVTFNIAGTDSTSACQSSCSC